MIVRSAVPSDKPLLASLLYYEAAIHRHLDWRPQLDWIGQSPFGVIEANGVIQAALACPADPPEINWIRLFAVSASISRQIAWQELWRFTLESLPKAQNLITIGAIPLHRWFLSLLEASGFEQHNEVVVLIWKVSQPQEKLNHTFFTIRTMNEQDLPLVTGVDHLAFRTPWQLSERGLGAGFDQAAIAMVAENETGIIGYQMSTVMNDTAHLARLAVLPQYQNQGVGTALVLALQDYCVRRRLRSLTVNTQSDNLASLHLYSRLGFQPTGEKYPLLLYERQP